MRKIGKQLDFIKLYDMFDIDVTKYGLQIRNQTEHSFYNFRLFCFHRCPDATKCMKKNILKIKNVKSRILVSQTKQWLKSAKSLVMNCVKDNI